MKIRCKIRRKLGSSQTLDGVTYHWHDGNDHTCEVDDPAHAERLLSFPESWEEVPGAPAKSPSRAPAAPGTTEGDGGEGEKSATTAPRRGGRRKADESAGQPSESTDSATEGDGGEGGEGDQQ